MDYNALKFLTLQSRLQWSSYRQSNGATHGYALAQDVSVDLGKLSLSTRFALFDTDDYDNRQYVYEKDVLYAFSIPAYYERGTRHYLLLHHPVNKHLDLWARFARTSLRNVDTMGSGLEEITQPRRSEVKFQVRYKL